MKLSAAPITKPIFILGCVVAWTAPDVVSGGEAAVSGAPASAPLFHALREGDQAAVKKLLRTGGSATVRDPLGNTPLMAASFHHDRFAVDLLLALGADCNATNQAG